MDVLVSGKTSFKIEVPYTLFETGEKGPKPLIVYLHGRGQYLDLFKKKTEALHELSAYHLYIQGPYPELTHTTDREKIGYSWYIYNGKQGSFVKSLEYTAEFIQEIIDGVVPFIKVTRLCMIGYSMGGYQAGYFALSRWKHTNELIVIGGRIKTELVTENGWQNLQHMNVLALHGADDEQVLGEPQRLSIETMKHQGVSADFETTPGGHALTPESLASAGRWLKKMGY
jgi:predicted esterase